MIRTHMNTHVYSMKNRTSHGTRSHNLTIILTINHNDTFPHTAFPGSVSEFVKKHSEKVDESVLVRQSKNKVKKCVKCGKPCAFTLHNCNSCGASLKAVKISYTNNVFTGFVFGIKKGPFPFTISKRSETKDVLVFDDLLALTPAHVNCIPTNVYVVLLCSTR